MRKVFLVILFIACQVIKLFAQDPSAAQIDPGKLWSLKDCMLYAIDNSSKTKIQAAYNDDKRLDYRQAYLGWVPSIEGSVTGNTSFGRSLDPETNIYTTSGSFSNNYSVGAGYTIFNGFQVVNNFRVSKMAKETGIQEYQQVQDDLCLQVIQAYFNVIHKIGLVKISGEQLEESQKNLKKTQMMTELGLKGQADLLQVEAQVATNDFNHVKAQNNLANDITTLKGLMFYPVNEPLQIDTNIVWIVDPYFEKESSDSIYTAAKTFLPAAKIVESQFKQSKLAYQTATLQILPSLTASASISTGYATPMGESAGTAKPFGEQFKNKMGEYVGLSLNIPIFDGLYRWNQKGKRKNQMLRAQYQQEQKLQEIETEIQRAVQDMEGAAKEYIQADRRAQAQEMAYRANKKKYDEGLIGVIELQTSSNQLLTSKVEKLNSALTYLLKAKVVKYYKGITYLDQE